MASASVNPLGQSSLAKRLGWPFLLLCCYRIGVHVPIPGVDAAALAAIDTTVDYLSLGLQIVSAVVDPEVYVIGGGASAGAALFLDALRERFAARAFPASSKCAIEVAELGNDAGIFGAAYVALRSVQREA